MKSCYLSIDFEDYTHDFQRMLGVSNPHHTPEALWKAYERIDRFATENLNGARFTFFTTGQVARDHPDIVRKIADDGHEIACHYNEHDDISTHDRETFRANLENAIERLSIASGQAIKGFRAPDFSINESCASWAYEEIARLFLYDSSYVTEKPGKFAHETQLFEFEGAILHEFPIYRRKLLPGLTARVIGGTYLRILPTVLIMKLLREAWNKGFLTLIYLHPYEFMHEYEQWSRFSDLDELPLGRRTYWWLRQHQWHTIGNYSIIRKLARIYQEFEHPGTMGSRFHESGQVGAQVSEYRVASEDMSITA